MKKITISINDSIYNHLRKEIERDVKWYSKDSILKALFGNIFSALTLAVLLMFYMKN